MNTAVAEAHPNIALVKYWGKRDRPLNLPATSSLSVTLDTFVTRTRVDWGSDEDEVVLDGRPADPRARERVLRFLDLVDPARPACRVTSGSSFPVAAGLASSSSAFAALALAATAAAGQERPPVALSALARRGSGSACRSIFGGFVLWRRGERPDGTDSHAVPLRPGADWPLRVVVAVADAGPKAVGSREGMVRTQATSPFFVPFVAENEGLVARAEAAVAARDLPSLIHLMERSTFLMHASMLGADPPLRYWKPATVALLDAVRDLQAAGVSCGVTMDAGPNVKVLCLPEDAERVAAALRPLASAVHVLGLGGGARLVSPD